MSKPKVTVNIDGVTTVTREIGLFDMQLRKDTIDVVKETSKSVQRMAKSKAPVSRTKKSKGASGDLKRSIRPKYFDGGLSSTVVPRKPRGAHRHLVEYGTKSRFTKRGAHRGKMPANPFMSPAEQAADAIFNQQMQKVVNRDKTI